MRWRNELIIDKTILNMKAHQNPSTLKPGTKFAARRITNASITNVNKPKVRIVIGSARIRRTGFIKALMIPKTTAVTKTATKLVT
jgi:hypothetical protein